MKKASNLFFLIIFSQLLLVSCSIEKRLHKPGYHISAIKKHNKSKKSTFETNDIAKNTEVIENTLGIKESKTNISNEIVAFKNEHTKFPEDRNSLVKQKLEDKPAAVKKKVKAESPSMKSNFNTSRAKNNTQKEYRFEATNTIKETQKNENKNRLYDTVLLVVVALFLPPLAVFFLEGDQWTNRVTINLILTILFFLPGVIHALYLILK